MWSSSVVSPYHLFEQLCASKKRLWQLTQTKLPGSGLGSGPIVGPQSSWKLWDTNSPPELVYKLPRLLADEATELVNVALLNLKTILSAITWQWRIKTNLFILQFTFNSLFMRTQLNKLVAMIFWVLWKCLFVQRRYAFYLISKTYYTI